MFGEHTVHLFLILLPIFIYLLILGKNRLSQHSIAKFKQITLLVVAFFVLFSALPTHLLMADHHLSQAPLANHDCCAPIVADVTPIVAINAPIKPLEPTVGSLHLPGVRIIKDKINNKSPPLIA